MSLTLQALTTLPLSTMCAASATNIAVFSELVSLELVELTSPTPERDAVTALRNLSQLMEAIEQRDGSEVSPAQIFDTRVRQYLDENDIPKGLELKRALLESESAYFGTLVQSLEEGGLGVYEELHKLLNFKSRIARAFRSIQMPEKERATLLEQKTPFFGFDPAGPHRSQEQATRARIDTLCSEWHEKQLDELVSIASDIASTNLRKAAIPLFRQLFACFWEYRLPYGNSNRSVIESKFSECINQIVAQIPKVGLGTDATSLFEQIISNANTVPGSLGLAWHLDAIALAIRDAKLGSEATNRLFEQLADRYSTILDSEHCYDRLYEAVNKTFHTKGLERLRRMFGERYPEISERSIVTFTPEFRRTISSLSGIRIPYPPSLNDLLRGLQKIMDSDDHRWLFYDLYNIVDLSEDVSTRERENRRHGGSIRRLKQLAKDIKLPGVDFSDDDDDLTPLGVFN
jgi:hypothetical protein